VLTLETRIRQAKERTAEHFEKNPTFIKQWDQTFLYYREVLKAITKEKENAPWEENLYAVMKSQLLNGYVVGLQLQETQPADVLKEFLSVPDAVIRDLVPTLLKEIALQPLADVYLTDMAQQWIRQMIQTYEGIRTPLRQICVNLLCYGAWLALLDRKTEIVGGETNQDSVESMSVLAAPSDLIFVSPAHYLMCDQLGRDFERWLLHWWSTYEREQLQVGEVVVLKAKDTPIRLFACLSDEIGDFEKTFILSNLQQQVTSAGQAIVIDVAVVKGFYKFLT
jgi:hypothetical protein